MWDICNIEKVYTKDDKYAYRVDIKLEDGRLVSNVLVTYPTPYQKMTLEVGQRFIVFIKNDRYYLGNYIPTDDEYTASSQGDNYSVLNSGNFERTNDKGNRFRTDFEYTHDTTESE